MRDIPTVGKSALRMQTPFGMNFLSLIGRWGPDNWRTFDWSKKRTFSVCDVHSTKEAAPLKDRALIEHILNGSGNGSLSWLYMCCLLNSITQFSKFLQIMCLCWTTTFLKKCGEIVFYIEYVLPVRYIAQI